MRPRDPEVDRMQFHVFDGLSMLRFMVYFTVVEENCVVNVENGLLRCRIIWRFVNQRWVFGLFISNSMAFFNVLNMVDAYW